MSNSVAQPTQQVVTPPALAKAKEIAELDPGAFNRALKLYLSKRGLKFKLSKPPANAGGEPLYGLHRMYPSRTKPIAKKTLEEWRQWFLDGGSLEDLR